MQRILRSSNSLNKFSSNTLSKRLFSLPAHGTQDGKLVNRLLVKGSDEYNDLWQQATGGNMYEIHLNHRQKCDIELLLNGAFSPLEGFMTSKQYDGVVEKMRLPDNTLFPIPITCDITREQARAIEESGHKRVLFRDPEYNPIAVMDVEDLWEPNKELEGELAFGGDIEHPAIHYLNNFTKDMYIGGKLHGFQLPPHYDHKDLRKTPSEVRELFLQRQWDQVVAFQTRNPMHRAHFELTKRALDENPNLNLLVHPVVGQTKPGDIDHHTRVKCYREIMPHYPKGRADLVCFPLAMRMAGPREAIWHCIIRKNYGLTHFILGRDHAGPGSNSKGQDFYGAYDARDAAVKHQKELGINTLAFEMMVYSPDDKVYYPVNEVPKGKEVWKLSGTEVRKRLRTGEEIPEWFSFGNVVDILRKAHPPRHKQGLTIFFTGLSGSGKSTIAEALREKLMEIQDRRIAMLDGDHVRKLISSGLGFTKEDRNMNIQRIGYISSLIANAGGISICAPIAPYKSSREFSRQCCSEVGGFVEIYVATSLDECKRRDRKGLYAKQQRGEMSGLSGVDDPYEEPDTAEIKIDAGVTPIEQSVDTIIMWLYKEGYLTKEMIEKEKTYQE